MRFFLSEIAGRPLSVNGLTFTFPISGRIGGSAYGIYETENAAELAALDSAIADKLGVTEITAAEYAVIAARATSRPAHSLPAIAVYPDQAGPADYWSDTGGGEPVVGAAGSTFSANLVAGQQSYDVLFDPVLDEAPTVVIPTVNMANDSGDTLSASVDWSTVTRHGCTIWLNGLPSASAGTIKGFAFV